MELELEQAPEEIIPPHDPVFVGEVRLSDFKDILTQHGFRVRFTLYTFLLPFPSLPECRVVCVDHHLHATSSLSHRPNSRLVC